MRSASALLALALFAGCAAPKDAAPPAPPAGPTLADFAGTWQNVATLTGVANPVPSTMTGTAADTGWTMSLEGRPNIAVQVSVVGDSLITQSAEYESVLRKGVMVSSRTAVAISNGMLTGTVLASYKTPTGVELVAGTMTGVRVVK